MSVEATIHHMFQKKWLILIFISLCIGEPAAPGDTDYQVCQAGCHEVLVLEITILIDKSLRLLEITVK